MDVQKKQSTSEISTVSEKLEDDNIGIYYNEEPLSSHKTKHSVLVLDLQAYVKKKLTGNDSFSKDFEVNNFVTPKLTVPFYCLETYWFTFEFSFLLEVTFWFTTSYYSGKKG